MIPRGLYGMADATFGDPERQVRVLAGEGVGAVQLRWKGAPDDALERLARTAAGLVPIVIVNDRADIAARVGVWTHLGQEDGAPPAGVPYGRSCHRLDEIDALPRDPWLRYIGFGPVFGTTTKDTGYSARGIDLLAEAVRRSPVPVVAIGGITPANVREVAAAGAHAWAVIGGVWAAADPVAAIHALRDPVTPSTR